jgi:hypothetical protein
MLSSVRANKHAVPPTSSLRVSVHNHLFHHKRRRSRANQLRVLREGMQRALPAAAGDRPRERRAQAYARVCWPTPVQSKSERFIGMAYPAKLSRSHALTL